MGYEAGEREEKNYKAVHKKFGYTVLREQKPLLDSMVYPPERPCEATGTRNSPLKTTRIEDISSGSCIPPMFHLTRFTPK